MNNTRATHIVLVCLAYFISFNLIYFSSSLSFFIFKYICNSFVVRCLYIMYMYSDINYFFGVQLIPKNKNVLWNPSGRY